VPAVLAGLVEYAGLALAFLEAVAAYLLAVAAIYMWVQIVRPIFGATSHFLPGGVKVFGQTVIPDLRNDWLRLEHGIYQGLLDWRRGSEIQIAWTWRQMGNAWGWTAAMVEWLAKETDQTFEALTHIHLPKWAKWIVAGAFPPLLIARLLKAILPHLHLHTTRISKYVTKEFPRTVVHLAPAAIETAFPGIVDIPWIEKQVYGLTRRNLRINWRLHRLEGLLTVAGLAAVMAKVWGVSPRCIKRNGPIGRVARRLCGLSAGALEDLLGLLVDALIVTDICEVITLLGDGMHIIEGPLDAIVSEVGGALCHGDYKAAPDVPPVTLSLPPVTGVVLSLA
jgi:hypothetical protein